MIKRTGYLPGKFHIQSHNHTGQLTSKTTETRISPGDTKRCCKKIQIVLGGIRISSMRSHYAGGCQKVKSYFLFPFMSRFAPSALQFHISESNPIEKFLLQFGKPVFHEVSKLTQLAQSQSKHKQREHMAGSGRAGSRFTGSPNLG